jgi:hypothetical protein
VTCSAVCSTSTGELHERVCAPFREATQVAETLGFGPDLHLYPVLCVHVARLPWLRELLVDGVPVLAAAALQVTRQALTPEQVALVAGQVRAGFRPAA